VIDNYLVNAIRHAPLKSDINITISGKGSGIRLEIANKTEAGEVFDFDINEIFNAKSQVELREQRKARGSGLGLIFSKMVIEAHQGKTGAMRNNNNETVFWFEI
jgi:signal transduction histidine kinase